MSRRSRFVWGVVGVLALLAAGCGSDTSGAGDGGAAGASDGTAAGERDAVGPCACASAGSVGYVFQSAAATGDALFVTAAVSWEPCCADPGSETRVYRVDPVTGASQRDEVPAGAQPVEAGSAALDAYFTDRNTVIVLELAVSGALGPTELAIGEVRNARTGETLATVRIDVSGP